MSLSDFRTLGRSGLVVSPLCLGTMTFGNGRWGTDAAVSRSMFDAYREAGGNFVDTADVYADGVSEQMLGTFIADCNVRDEIVLATKFGFNSSKGNPHTGGSGAKNIHRALEGSLERLGTDYIDLYWMHIWDSVTPVEEICQTLGDLVRAGKIRYFGFSDMPAWVAMKAATIASERRVPGPIAMQLEYSLVSRDVEREHIPAALEAGMGVMPWSPLAGGFLTGKYTQSDTSDVGRLSGPNPLGDSKFTDRNWHLLDVLREVADAQGRPLSQVAIAWVTARPGVSSTLIGASRAEQLLDNIEALDVHLTSGQTAALDAACANETGFTDMLAAPDVRKMIFGGHTVKNWNESWS